MNAAADHTLLPENTQALARALAADGNPFGLRALSLVSQHARAVVDEMARRGLTVAKQPPPLLLKATDLAALLGESLKTIQRWDDDGKLPKPLSIRRWLRSEILEWLARGTPDRATWQELKRSGVVRLGQPRGPSLRLAAEN